MNKYNWSNKEQFLEDWENSKNVCSFLRNKELTLTSGNYKTFKKWYEIHTNELMPNKKKSVGNIFSENSIVNRKEINKKIKTLNLLKYECSGCSNPGIWNGKPLKLQLEHKNGINNDNRIENLEYLCPNCHSQTKSFAGSNVHNKVFENRLTDILSFNQKIISNSMINELSKKWNRKIISIINWLKKYENKLKENNIQLNIDLIKYREKNTISKMKIETDIYTSKNDIQEIQINDIGIAIEKENPVEVLKQDWNTTRHNVKKKIQKFGLESLHVNFKMEEVREINKEERISDVLKIENKKQVLELSKKWKTSVNGAKKWIRNNLPDKFKEIYDDKHLIKNKKKIIQQEKIQYLQSLKENFNEEEAMKFLNINKTGLYTQIKAHNPDLLDKLHNKYLCPKCNNKTRSNGSLRRCLVCDHSFKPKLVQDSNLTISN